MNRMQEPLPLAVPITAKRGGEVRSRWEWTEPAVWSDRMLTALEQGVKGGVWYSLIDKVALLENLQVAFTKVKANKGAPGVDHITIKRFAEDLEANLKRLSQELKAGTYQPQAVRRVEIPKPGTKETRPLGIPTVRDRVVQSALRQVIEPIFEREFAQQSYGFRPKRGCKDALRRVDGLLKEGRTWVVDADLKSYFDTISHDRLMTLLRGKIRDGKVLDLLALYLKQPVMDSLREWNPVMGTPQGAVISPLLANLYLDALDHLLASKGYEMVRYADDFVVLCTSEQESLDALGLIREWTEAAALRLHPEKTRIVHTRHEGFDFLGYHFYRNLKGPREKSLRKFKEVIRSKTKRTSGLKLEEIIKDVNRTVRGWYGYFKHSRRALFAKLDGEIRRRLRAILNKRRGVPKFSVSKADHARWPKQFFKENGFFSMLEAHILESQSCHR